MKNMWNMELPYMNHFLRAIPQHILHITWSHDCKTWVTNEMVQKLGFWMEYTSLQIILSRLPFRMLGAKKHLNAHTSHTHTHTLRTHITYRWHLYAHYTHITLYTHRTHITHTHLEICSGAFGKVQVDTSAWAAMLLDNEQVVQPQRELWECVICTWGLSPRQNLKCNPVMFQGSCCIAPPPGKAKMFIHLGELLVSSRINGHPTLHLNEGMTPLDAWHCVSVPGQWCRARVSPAH